MRGDTVRVGIGAPGRSVVTLASRSTGTAWHSAGLPVLDGRASAPLGPLDADLTLVASDGRAVSDTVVVRVRDRAFVGDVGVQAVYPAYLHRASEALPGGEPMRVPHGTELRSRGARPPTSRAPDSLATAAATRCALPRTGAAPPAGSMRAPAARGAGSPRRRTDPIADVPPPLDVEVVPDAPPHAEILAPASDTLVRRAAIVTLRLVASDDHGVARVALHLRSETEGRMGAESELAGRAARHTGWAGEIPFDLASRSLAPGDAVHISARGDGRFALETDGREPRAGDPRADARRGARDRARAGRQRRGAHGERGGGTEGSHAAHAGGGARAVRPQHRHERRRSGERPASRTMSYETAERAAALAREQEQLAQRVHDAQQDDEGAGARAARRPAHSTRRSRGSCAMRRSCCGEALTPEMARQLEARRCRRRRSSRPRRRGARSSSSAQQQERLRAELERTAGMLKRAALEGAMQTLRDDARELAAKSSAVADSLARRDTSARAGAKSLSDQSKALADQVRQLGERLAKEQADVAAAKMPSAAQHAQRSSEQHERARSARAGRSRRQ